MGQNLNKHFRRPVFMLTAASLVLFAFIQAENAGAQTANGGSSSSSSSEKRYDKAGIKVGSLLFVTTDKLNLRNKASLGSDAVVGALGKNDQVQVLDVLDSSTPLVKIKIVKSSQVDNSVAANLFASSDYLSAQAISKSVDDNSSSGELSKYIVIQNIAAEKTRVYERCTTTPGCPHHLVMETEMVVGRPSEGDKSATWVGRFKLTEWIKFYEDDGNTYPSFYDPNYPALPSPGSSLISWLSKSLLPNRQGHWRGAFGWYAGKVGPNANSQWIHGTFGWGADGDKFVMATKKGLFAAFKDLRSAGCTRHENRAVAYLRHILPVGTEVLRVYAREGVRDTSLSAYQDQRELVPWEFILTKDGVRQSGGPDSDKQKVLASGISQDRILEQGTYQVDEYPTPMKFVEDATHGQRRKGLSGNIYGIPDENFRGYFLVDEGRFIDYRHPEGVQVGGFDDHSMPEYLKTSGAVSVP